MICDEITNGINDIYIRLGCKLESVCVDLEVEPQLHESTITMCGTEVAVSSVTGYELKIKSTKPLEIDVDTGCYKTVDIFVVSRSEPQRIAGFMDAVISFAGFKVSAGVWLHHYTATARKSQITDSIPPPTVNLEFDRCLYSLNAGENEGTGMCGLDGITFTVYAASDPDTPVETVSLVDGLLTASDGTVWGTMDAFSVPLGSFTIVGTVLSDGTHYEFSQASAAECPTINLSLGTGGGAYIEGLSTTTEFDVTVHDYTAGTETTTSHVGSHLVVSNNPGHIVITGCGINLLNVLGDVQEVDLGQSCVTNLGVHLSNTVSIVGEGHFITTYTGNSVAEPSCDWPLLHYSEFGLSGVVDLSCWEGLLYADISRGSVTGIIPNPTVEELYVYQNPSLTEFTSRICEFTNLRYLRCNLCNFSSFNFDCLPNLETLIAWSNNISTITKTAPTGVTHLSLNDNPITIRLTDFLGTDFPLLETLYWGYVGTNDLITPHLMPELKTFVVSATNADPSPFYSTISPVTPAWSKLETFTYAQAPAIPSDLYAPLVSLVDGGASNATINLNFGTPPPDATACGFIATLEARGCTVNRAAGGSC